MKKLFKRIWPELAPHKWTVAFVLITGSIASGLKALTAYLVELTSKNWSLGNTDLWSIIQFPLIILAIQLIMNLIRYFNMFKARYVGDLITVKLRKQLMDKYLELGGDSLASKFNQGTGGFISRMVNDILIVQNEFIKLSVLIREPLVIVGCFVYLFILDWGLTLAILFTLPLIALMLKSITKSIRKYGQTNQEIMEELTQTLKESLDGSRVVQSFNLEPEMRRSFNEQTERYLKSRRKIISREELVGPINEVISAMALTGVLLVIGHKIGIGSLTKDSFLGFMTAIGLIADSIRKTQGSIVGLQYIRVSLGRIDDIINIRKNIYLSKKPIPFPENWKHIEFKDVSFKFEDSDSLILNKINLKINRGEVVALVGSSGGGKSTFVNLIERFFDPTEGSILIDNIDIKEFDLTELRNNISLVNQDVFLFSDTIERNIHLGRQEKDIKLVPEAAKTANAHDFITQNEYDYQSIVGDRGSRFSGGEKQRISIARAVFKDAPILILDEATSALDSENEVEVQKGLDRLMTNRTAFVISHRLSTIVNADRILVLKSGNIAEQGSHKELMDKKGDYFKLIEMQSSK